MSDDFAMDYDLALVRISHQLTERQRDILSSMYAAPEGVAAGLMAPLLGLSHHAPLNRAMAGLGRALTEAVDAEPPRRSDGSARWWRVVSTGDGKREGRFFWILRPDLRDAITRQRLFEPNSTVFPETVEAGTSVLVEGAVLRVSTNVYERNPIARRQCIAHYGTSCAVCEFNFGTFYGPMAEGVIHVHHLVPLAAAGGVNYVIDPVRDLRPVCPNCHVVIHRRDPPLSLEEARAVVSAHGCRPTRSST